ncbi:hypothetical protein [Haematobacter sp.]|uniref:hypothetical protein n=1 Tax=Haematobacter sp. TaxID=2953762 RepID=UPI0028AB8731|nr:hypothetical protein [Haematobacter sp.]
MTFEFCFPAVPPIGTVLNYTKGRTIKMIGSEPYVRKDGQKSAVLVWQCSDGRTGTSGLTAGGLDFRKCKVSAR